MKQEDPFLSSVETKPTGALIPTSQVQDSTMLSLKGTSEAHTSPDAISYQDCPVHSTASGDVHCGSIPHDFEISVSDEDETCTPGPTALLDQRDITSSLATEVAQCHFHNALTPVSGMGCKQSQQSSIISLYCLT